MTITAEVSREVLNLLFDEFGIWAKIHDGRLTSQYADQAPSKRWTDATSLIVKHFLPGGKHIATTHCVKDSQGSVVHWDAKDFKFNEVRLRRS